MPLDSLSAAPVPHKWKEQTRSGAAQVRCCRGRASTVETCLPGAFGANGSGGFQPPQRGRRLPLLPPGPGGVHGAPVGAGPSPSTPASPGSPHKTAPRVSLQPRYSGFRVQGTATAPPSTTTGSIRWHKRQYPERVSTYFRRALKNAFMIWLHSSARTPSVTSMR